MKEKTYFNLKWDILKGFCRSRCSLVFLDALEFLEHLETYHLSLITYHLPLTTYHLSLKFYIHYRGSYVVYDIGGDEAKLALLGGSQVAGMAVDKDSHPHAAVG